MSRDMVLKLLPGNRIHVCNCTLITSLLIEHWTAMNVRVHVLSISVCVTKGVGL